MKEQDKDKNREVINVCTQLTNENKKYVLAVANALKFAQCQNKDAS